MSSEPVIIVHGGAWAIPEHLTIGSLEGVRRAANEGHKVLSAGGSAVDAVVAAVTVLEDDPLFDAGHGAVLNRKGQIELDAIVVDGRTLESGAVCCVQDIANPVKLARAVMEKTGHCLLAAEGANEFAQEIGISKVNPDELLTPEAKAEFESYRKYSEAVDSLYHARTDMVTLPGCDTVGAVAMDKQGYLASATSTGGITAKRPGRVGDSPIIGAGAYADNEVGAVSTTGHGESIMKVCLARRVGEFIEKGLSPKESADQALGFMNRRVKGAGGVIVINSSGQVGHAFTSERMAWAEAQEGILRYGIDPEKIFEEAL